MYGNLQEKKQEREIAYRVGKWRDNMGVWWKTAQWARKGNKTL